MWSSKLNYYFKQSSNIIITLEIRTYTTSSVQFLRHSQMRKSCIQFKKCHCQSEIREKKNNNIKNLPPPLSVENIYMLRLKRQMGQAAGWVELWECNNNYNNKNTELNLYKWLEDRFSIDVSMNHYIVIFIVFRLLFQLFPNENISFDFFFLRIQFWNRFHFNKYLFKSQLLTLTIYFFFSTNCSYSLCNPPSSISHSIYSFSK